MNVESTLLEIYIPHSKLYGVGLPAHSSQVYARYQDMAGWVERGQLERYMIVGPSL